jgi:hypothetical protein
MESKEQDEIWKRANPHPFQMAFISMSLFQDHRFLLQHQQKRAMKVVAIGRKKLSFSIFME